MPDRPRADMTDYGEESATDPERAAIGALQRLAKRWPRTLMLLSYDGGLSIIHTADLDAIADGYGPERQDLVLASINDIPNDGGGW
jgi:hypothetical protein